MRLIQAQTEALEAQQQSARAPASAPRTLYRCDKPDGVPHYSSAPMEGYACREIAVYESRPSAAAQALPAAPVRQAPRGLVFHGYPCTQDCSGHEAGYEWAEEEGIDDEDDCSGWSQSFIEGCKAYVEEHY